MKKLARLIILLSAGAIWCVAVHAQEKFPDKVPFTGKYYPGTSSQNNPPVLVLGGSEGGIPTKFADAVVESGHPVLALGYFKADGLPDELELIPLEYFSDAMSWIQQRSNNADNVIIVGWSKGAELALLLASKHSEVSRVVAIAPSNVVWAGIMNDWTAVPDSSWSEGGKPLTHIPFRPSGKINGLLDLYSQSLENREDGGEADIAVENIQAAVTLMTGGMDDIWPSGDMASQVCLRMNKVREGSCEHLHYEGLGHLLNYRMLDDADALHNVFLNKVTGN